MVIFIDGNFVIVAIYLTNSIKGNSSSICHGYREERTHRYKNKKNELLFREKP